MRAEGLAEFQCAAGVAGVEHDRLLRRPAGLGKRDRDGGMGEGRQDDEGRIGIRNRRMEIMGDRLRPSEAGAKQAFVADAALGLERGKRLGRPVPEDDVMPDRDELDHGRSAAGSGSEHGDFHGRLGQSASLMAGGLRMSAGQDDMPNDLSHGVITP